MAGYGPPREPLRFKVFKGTAGRRPKPSRQPTAPVAPPACPAWLDPVARREWRRIVPLLLRARSIAKLDRAVLASYCAAWSRLRAANEALQLHGTTQKTRAGIVRRPETAIASEAEKSLRQSADALGLSPHARSRIVTPVDAVTFDPLMDDPPEDTAGGRFNTARDILGD